MMDDLKERLRANGLDECDEAIDRIEALEDRIARADALADAFIGVVASLSAAISLLEKGGRAAAPSKNMFDQLLIDYKRSLEQARAADREGSDT